MRSLFFAAALAVAPLAAITALAPATALAAEAKPKDRGGVTVSQLRKIVDNLGYTTKDGSGTDSPNFEFTVNDGGLDIYILVEQSKSTNYIWMKLAFDKLKPGQDPKAFLTQTGAIQPAHFYLYEDGTLGMAVAVENRDVTPAVIKRGIDILVDGAVNTQDYWLSK
ncbi:MAG: hypothetical protein Q7T61_08200 [Caulobacter sp.]|nr:hypothetical protein [Caulobacter sp.]